MFSSKSFIVSGLTFGSLIHFEFMYKQREKRRKKWSKFWGSPGGLVVKNLPDNAEDSQ